MRQIAIVLSFLFVVAGCVQETTFGSLDEELKVEDRNGNPPLYSVPDDNREDGSVEMSTMTISPTPELQSTPPILEMCLCEWDSWEEEGLLCLGVLCSSACSVEVAACRESRRVCVAR